MVQKNHAKQDCQALLKAKYCLCAAALSRTQKNTWKPVWPSVTFDRWPWNSTGF